MTRPSFTAFDRIWRRLAEAGACDSHGDAEYRRVRSEWQTAGRPTRIEAFVRRQANVGPLPVGRPSLAGVGPTARLEIRISPTDRDAWTAAADREGLTLSEWLRAAAELAIARGATR
jgi:hypothetical protein